VAFLVDRIRTLSADSPPEEIAIVARTRSRVHAYADALDGAGIAHIILDADGAPSGPGVRLATMHRVKGLDFTHVIMHMPGGGTSSRDPRDQSLLYVAATRCRRTLTVVQEAG
jgi:superfamily I DNA/RNA helicase